MRLRARDRLMPVLGLRIRGHRNRRSLHGLGAPASLLAQLVEPGTTALDVGANLGLYTYWIAKRAAAVHAFEPNPPLASYLRRARLLGVVVHDAAASNTAGAATLRIPEVLGEAHLVDGGSAGRGADLSVRTMTIDSLALTGVSFVKVDVEGHEAQALEGAHDTLRRNRPVVFIELEERHAAGTVERTAAYFLDELGYGTGAFMRGGTFHPISEFDGPEMQPIEHVDRAGSDYVSNFLFTPRGPMGASRP